MSGYKKSVFKTFTLISQLGIMVMVPIAACVAIGVLIDQHYQTYWTIPLMILGMLAGGRNAYRLAKAASKDDAKTKPEEQSKEFHDSQKESDE